MPTTKKTIVQEWYEFALIQMSKESYLEQYAAEDATLSP